MRLKNLLDYYTNRLDRTMEAEIITMVAEEVKEARETALREGKILRENEIKTKLLKILLQE